MSTPHTSKVRNAIHGLATTLAVLGLAAAVGCGGSSGSGSGSGSTGGLVRAISGSVSVPDEVIVTPVASARQAAQDGGEVSPLAGMGVRLFTLAGIASGADPISTTLLDAAGNYSFTDVPDAELVVIADIVTAAGNVAVGGVADAVGTVKDLDETTQIACAAIVGLVKDGEDATAFLGDIIDAIEELAVSLAEVTDLTDSEAFASSVTTLIGTVLASDILPVVEEPPAEEPPSEEPPTEEPPTGGTDLAGLAGEWEVSVANIQTNGDLCLFVEPGDLPAAGDVESIVIDISEPDGLTVFFDDPTALSGVGMIEGTFDPATGAWSGSRDFTVEESGLTSSVMVSVDVIFGDGTGVGTAGTTVTADLLGSCAVTNDVLLTQL